MRNKEELSLYDFLIASCEFLRETFQRRQGCSRNNNKFPSDLRNCEKEIVSLITRHATSNLWVSFYDLFSSRSLCVSQSLLTTIRGNLWQNLVKPIFLGYFWLNGWLNHISLRLTMTNRPSLMNRNQISAEISKWNSNLYKETFFSQ